jgi:hypothetical protein
MSKTGKVLQMPEPGMSVRLVAEALKCSSASVLHFIRKGDLRAKRARGGNRWLVDGDSVAELINGAERIGGNVRHQRLADLDRLAALRLEGRMIHQRL